MGKGKAKEMSIWTRDEYLKFADSMMDKEISYHAFELLYWCGMRMGEMLALTPNDFDFEKQTVSISKTYQRLQGKDVITDPKSVKSNRVIQMPTFLNEEMQNYITHIYHIKKDNRIFPVTKSYIEHEMIRGTREQGLRKIRVHDLRHPYVKPTTKKFASFLKFFRAAAIAARSCSIRYSWLMLPFQISPFLKSPA